MSGIFLAVIISDVVWQGLISNSFWLVIFLAVVVVFRREIRLLLESLASFKIAGASFELKDRRATLEYYAILTNILVEILSQRDSAENIVQFISDNSARQLSRFTLKYSKEVPGEDKDVELLKNVALIVGRKGNVQEAVAFYDALLKQAPGDRDLLNLKGIMLQDSGTEEGMAKAQNIFDDLVKRYPNIGIYWYNRALLRSRLGKFDESMADLDRAIELDFHKRKPSMLSVRPLQPLRDNRPEDFKALEAKLETLKGKA